MSVVVVWCFLSSPMDNPGQKVDKTASKNNWHTHTHTFRDGCGTLNCCLLTTKICQAADGLSCKLMPGRLADTRIEVLVANDVKTNLDKALR